MATNEWFQGGTLYGNRVPPEKFREGLAAEIQRQADTKEDFVLPSTRIHMGINHDAVDGETAPYPYLSLLTDLDNGSRMFRIRPWAHRQISEKTKIPWKYYERMLVDKPYLLATNVNEWWMTQPKRMIRTLDGEVRAVVSSRFKALDNVDLFYNAAREMEAANAQITRADLSETRFYLRAIVPDVRRAIDAGDEICGGVMFSNSEVGAGALRISSFVTRLACKNGMIGNTVWDRVHLGSQMRVGRYVSRETVDAQARAIWLEARDYIRYAFDARSLDDFVDKFKHAKQVDIEESRVDLAQGSWQNMKVSESEKSSILDNLLRGTDGYTQFGMVNGITATARDTLDADRRAELERMAFEVLCENNQQFGRRMEQAVVQAKTGGR